MTEDRTIAVYGASGLTGGFVVSELRRRGWRPVLSGRPGPRLAAAGHESGVVVRPAPVDDPDALDRAFAGVAAVANCAGPFAVTAQPVAEAARRAGVPYLDVAAEIEAVADTFAREDGPARVAGVLVVPALAFYGGLGDLLATVAVDGWPGADEVAVAYALDGWRPTAGTREAGRTTRARRDGRRVVHTGGRLTHRHDPAPTTTWEFPPPVGPQEAHTEFTMADSVTIPRHLAVPEIRTYMTVGAVRDLVDPDLATRPSDDHDGVGGQRFLVEVVARRGDDERRAVAGGQDIYAISASLVVEAAARVLGGEVPLTGARSAGEALDAAAVLRSLPLASLVLP